MFSPYQPNSCYESDYECSCIMINGKTCSVPLIILSSVHYSSRIRYKLACEHIKFQNKAAYPHSLIRVLFFHLKNVGHLATHRAHIEDADQTARMRRLIRIFDRRTCQLVTFAGHRSY